MEEREVLYPAIVSENRVICKTNFKKCGCLCLKFPFINFQQQNFPFACEELGSISFPSTACERPHAQDALSQSHQFFSQKPSELLTAVSPDNRQQKFISRTQYVLLPSSFSLPRLRSRDIDYAAVSALLFFVFLLLLLDSYFCIYS